MLQEAVDSLFDNSRKVNAVKADGNRALKSFQICLKVSKVVSVKTY